jgi:hypothetical protein
VGKPEAKRLLSRPRHRWVDNINMDHGEIGWVGLAQGSCDNGSIKCWEVLE